MRRANSSFIVSRSMEQLSFFLSPSFRGFFGVMFASAELSSECQTTHQRSYVACSRRISFSCTCKKVRGIERVRGHSESFRLFDRSHFAGMFSQTLREEPCASYPSLSKKSECAALTLYLLYTLPEACEGYSTNRTWYKCCSTPITFLLKETLSYFVSLALSKQLFSFFFSLWHL